MLDEREGGGEEFWIFTDGHFHPIFLIRFDMLKIIVVVYNFWKRVIVIKVLENNAETDSQRSWETC